MIDITLLGTGGMMPLPYRALTSLMVRYNGRSLLIDTGEATQISIRRRGWSFNPIDTILITHFHADHISGLPGLLLAMGNADRTEPVTIIGPEETVSSLLRDISREKWRRWMEMLGKKPSVNVENLITCMQSLGVENPKESPWTKNFTTPVFDALQLLDMEDKEEKSNA